MPVVLGSWSYWLSPRQNCW